MRVVRSILAHSSYRVHFVPAQYLTSSQKSKVLRWNLHKKLHLPEMRTALKLLGPDQSQWPSQEPQFRIRRKVFSLGEILRSYGRRGIQDPFEWVQATPNHSYEHSSTVELLTPSTTASTEPGDIDQNVSGGALAAPNPLCTAPPSPPAPKGGSEEIFQQTPNYEHEVISNVNWSLQDPDIHVYTATAVQQIQSYCRMYMASSYALVHGEPEVHHFTSHARFLDHMDEGISLFVSGNMDLAFKKFRLGFAMLKDVLVDLHPMATAIYFLLLCKLTVNKVQQLAVMLLQHTIQLASAIHTRTTRLLALFSAILKAGELLEMPLVCLRAASDTLEANDPTNWKTLYVKERHCDALYHAGLYGEGAIRRAQLLTLQESRYGPSARNVLWTSLNVADDHLIHGQLLEAEQRFSIVAQQSELHLGYNRAKSRIVALEGLAKVAYVRFCRQLDAHLDSSVALQSWHEALYQQQKALKFVNEAIELAQVWITGPNRRTRRLLDLRYKVQAAAIQLKSTPP